MKGKNFSLNNLGQRKKSDFYETPYSMTQQIIDNEPLHGSVLEPACGNGAIVKILSQNGIYAMSYDKEVDFLKDETKWDCIITNPPFSLAFEFIQKAKISARRKFIFLLPLSYLHGKKRFDEIYSDKNYPLARVYVFTRYPMLGEPLRDDGKYNTGMMVYAWFVWQKDYIGQPRIHWLDNNEFVLRGDQ